MGTKYAALSKREVIRQNIAATEESLSDPAMSRILKRKDRVIQSHKREKENLLALTPPDIDGDSERKGLMTRCQQLEHAMIKGSQKLGVEPMPTRREMWDNPAGAIGQNTRWQQFWKHNTINESGQIVRSKNGYGGIFEWKDKRRTLFKEREEDDKDVANVEIIRPDTRDNSGLANYQSRTYGMPVMSYAQYDEVFPEHIPSDVELKLRKAEKEASGEDKFEDLAETEARVKKQNLSERGKEVDNLPKADKIWTRCAFVDPETKRQCRFRAKSDGNFCKHHVSN